MLSSMMRCDRSCATFASWRHSSAFALASTRVIRLGLSSAICDFLSPPLINVSNDTSVQMEPIPARPLPVSRPAHEDALRMHPSPLRRATHNLFRANYLFRSALNAR